MITMSMYRESAILLYRGLMEASNSCGLRCSLKAWRYNKLLEAVEGPRGVSQASQAVDAVGKDRWKPSVRAQEATRHCLYLRCY